MTSVSKNMYLYNLDDIVNKYSDTYHITIKMKVKHLFWLWWKNNGKDLKFRDHVWISKYRNIFAKGYTQSWSEDVFIIKKAENTVPWTYVTEDING